MPNATGLKHACCKPNDFQALPAFACRIFNGHARMSAMWFLIVEQIQVLYHLKYPAVGIAWPKLFFFPLLRPISLWGSVLTLGEAGKQIKNIMKHLGTSIVPLVYPP